jgi:hypothetical protein
MMSAVHLNDVSSQPAVLLQFVIMWREGDVQ